MDCTTSSPWFTQSVFHSKSDSKRSARTSSLSHSIIEERARQHNRIQKVLEGASIKLGSVVSDIMGVSAKDMLRPDADGEDDPKKLENFARRTMKKTKEELELALKGYVNHIHD